MIPGQVRWLRVGRAAPRSPSLRNQRNFRLHHWECAGTGCLQDKSTRASKSISTSVPRLSACVLCLENVARGAQHASPHGLPGEELPHACEHVSGGSGCLQDTHHRATASVAVIMVVAACHTCRCVCSSPAVQAPQRPGADARGPGWCEERGWPTPAVWLPGPRASRRCQGPPCPCSRRPQRALLPDHAPACWMPGETAGRMKMFMKNLSNDTSRGAEEQAGDGSL